MVDQRHLFGAEPPLRDRERADHVVGDHPAGVAQDVRLAVLEPERGEDVESRVHAGDDREPQRRPHVEVPVARASDELAVLLEQVVDHIHEPIMAGVFSHTLSMRNRRLIALLAVVVVLAGFAGIDATASSQSGPWPAVPVSALWPTFASVPIAESGMGGVRGWNGALRWCRASTRVSRDFACAYGDGKGRMGYICLAARAPLDGISASLLTARVAPGDETYRSAAPSQVCAVVARVRAQSRLEGCYRPMTGE